MELLQKKEVSKYDINLKRFLLFLVSESILLFGNQTMQNSCFGAAALDDLYHHAYTGEKSA